MFKLNTKCMKDTYESGVKATEKAISTMKDISIRPKIDATFEIKSRQRQKSIFSADLHVDKEFSVWKMLRTILLIFAALGLIRMFFDMIFTCDNKKCQEDCEAYE